MIAVRIQAGTLPRVAMRLEAAAGQAKRLPVAFVAGVGPVVRRAMIPALTYQTGLGGAVIRRAVTGGVVGSAYAIKSRGGNVRLKFFGAKETPLGVSAAPWNRRRVYPGTFMKGGRFPNRVDAPKLGGHVFKRVGSKRLAIVGQRSGLFIPQEMVTGESAATFHATLRTVGGSQLRRSLASLLGA